MDSICIKTISSLHSKLCHEWGSIWWYADRVWYYRAKLCQLQTELYEHKLQFQEVYILWEICFLTSPENAWNCVSFHTHWYLMYIDVGSGGSQVSRLDTQYPVWNKGGGGGEVRTRNRQFCSAVLKFQALHALVTVCLMILHSMCLTHLYLAADCLLKTASAFRYWPVPSCNITHQILVAKIWILADCCCCIFRVD